MQNFTFTNNSLQQKFQVSNPSSRQSRSANNRSSNNRSSNNRSSNNRSSNTVTNSLVPKQLALKINSCFTNGQPYVFKNSGLQITFNDCTTVQEATIKVAKVMSRLAAQKRTITIAGKKYTSFTNESYTKMVDCAFADHYEQHCTINDINGSYNTLATYNYGF